MGTAVYAQSRRCRTVRGQCAHVGLTAVRPHVWPHPRGGLAPSAARHSGRGPTASWNGDGLWPWGNNQSGLSRCSHVRMGAKRHALEEMAARQRAADEKQQENAGRDQTTAIVPLRAGSPMPAVVHGLPATVIARAAMRPQKEIPDGINIGYNCCP